VLTIESPVLSILENVPRDFEMGCVPWMRFSRSRSEVPIARWLEAVRSQGLKSIVLKIQNEVVTGRDMTSTGSA
jgi:hypothetical protein